MRVECPGCSARGNIDAGRLPADGRQITCPRCSRRFHVRPERSAVEVIQQRERMVCPGCNHEQPLAETCAGCGIVIKKYIQVQVHQQEKERLEFVRLRSETRSVDAWYKDLFDRRLTTLVVRILSLLVLVCLFMTCSYNSARRNRFYAENTAEMKKITEGQSQKLSPEKIDRDFRDRFSGVVEMLAENSEACLSQNYNYKTSWYQHAQPYSLTEYMADNLGTINRRRYEVESAFRALPTPSKAYYDCYLKVKGLSNLHEEICRMANAYSTHFPDFNERLSNFSYELNRKTDELNACKSSLK